MPLHLAFSSKDLYVPNPAKDYSASRWIASISDGATVFEDLTPGIKTAWRRLREYVAIQGLKITNLRLEAFNRRITLIPYKGEDGTPQINGYWYSKKIGVLVANNFKHQSDFVGIGFLKGRDIYLTWVDNLGQIKQEIRKYDPKKIDEALIINDNP